MKHIPITRMVVAAMLLAAPAFNVAAQQDNSAVLQRLAALEARVAALEGRPTVASTANAAWQDPEKWKRLRKGMTEKEVTDLLGPQTRGDRRSDGATVLLYLDPLNIHHGSVHLMQDHVYHWSEPVF
ncbi:MAG: hypothetical protein ACREP4_07430 [Stenotrophomonas sp.]|uniref:hypothetical protein n=1 Tax=Stenotrophomonas sp. TaxID=69392 RepID=UPI003D6D4A5B